MEPLNSIVEEKTYNIIRENVEVPINIEDLNLDSRPLITRWVVLPPA